MWKEALRASRSKATDKQPDQVKNALTVPLDRFKAMRFKEKNKVDVRGRKSIFGQMFRKLYGQPPAFYRLDQGVRAFLVEFKGEGGEDVGGLYREGLFLVCKSSSRSCCRFSCPVQIAAMMWAKTGKKYVPNPEAVEPLHVSMLELIGKLMGLALRTKNSLNLACLGWSGNCSWTALQMPTWLRLTIWHLLNRRSWRQVATWKQVHSKPSMDPGRMRRPTLWDNRSRFERMARTRPRKSQRTITKILCRRVLLSAWRIWAAGGRSASRAGHGGAVCARGDVHMGRNRTGSVRRA